MMQINDDYSERIVLNTEEMPWIAAPSGGVERRMIERSVQKAAAPHQLSATRPAPAFQNTSIRVAKKYWCFLGFFRTRLATIQRAAICAIRRAPGTRLIATAGA